IRILRPARLIMMGAIIFLLLPWGEWLKIGFLTNRSEWSFFWLNAALFVYCCFIFADCLPAVSMFVQNQIQKLRSLMDSPRWMFLLPLLVFCLASFICLVYRGGISHIQDGISYMFEAKIIASERFWASAPRLPEFFTAPGDMMY